MGAARVPLENGVIEVDIHAKRYGPAPVLGPVAFTVSKGETVALVGPSGVGKSTLLRIVAGVDPHYDGRVSRPEACAVVFQEPTLLLWRSAAQNLTLVHPELGASGAEAALASVGLAGMGGLFPGQLSLGQQRRLALARAFAGAPDLLILDEPFASLDAETADAMLSLTERLLADRPIATLFVTHDPEEAKRLADRILTLSPGEDGATLSKP